MCMRMACTNVGGRACSASRSEDRKAAYAMQRDVTQTTWQPPAGIAYTIARFKWSHVSTDLYMKKQASAQRNDKVQVER